MEPFKILTVELSAEKNVAGSKIVIMLREILKAKRKCSMITTFKLDSQNLARNLYDGIVARFPSVEMNLGITIPTFLDPRFKKRGIVSKEGYTQTKAKVQQLIANLVREENYAAPLPEVVPVKENLIWGEFDKQNLVDISVSTPSSTAIIELRQYCEEPTIDRHESPLEWWQKRELVYPRLAILAKRYLCLVPTSVPSERVFSRAGELISKKRNRLNNKNVRAIMFLNGNMRYY